ncbi:MAG: NAD-dependent malic enzyme, partial [Actinomycetota bacterium]
GLRGFLPPHVHTIEEQLLRVREGLARQPDDLQKWVFLNSLHDRNETLFFRLLMDSPEELMPLVYTPTVGRACQEYAHLFQQPRGLFISAKDKGRIAQILRNWPYPDVGVIVVTDGERILGLGDLGAGGMGIPVGKLSLYTACAGVAPIRTLPVTLDVGTDNPKLLEDPYYLGYRKPRLRGERYDEFVEAFVEAVCDVFPHAILQWEDFKQHNAIRLLDRYRHRVTSFNDDIQGTSAVVLAGIFTALRHLNEPMGAQRFVFLGAGAAGIGIARLVRAQMKREGVPETDIRRAIVMLDSNGLTFEGRTPLDDDKREFALDAELMAHFGFTGAERYSLETVIRHVRPTMLLGTSGTPGTFTEGAIREMGRHVKTPIVFPMSNPTSKTEAQPADILEWTEGRAIIATGSPFEPVPVDGKPRLIGQANNAFCFPGIGLGAIVAEAREVTDTFFLAAAEACADSVPAETLEAGSLYPNQSQLREVSREIARRIVRVARDAGVGRVIADEEVDAAIDAMMWWPAYAPYRPAN